MSKELYFHHREFELAVRNELMIFDRPIFDDDSASVTDLDCSNFNFMSEDYETLSTFINLEQLHIVTQTDALGIITSFVKLESLYLECWSPQNYLDFNYLSNLQRLTSLIISGGDVSDMNLCNLDALANFKKLQDLTLHEFGSVDISPLSHMYNLTEFYCGYANRVDNIDVIGTLSNLEALTLIDIKTDNLDFLDSLSDNVVLELCSIELNKGINLKKLNRFANSDICDITVNGVCII